VGAFESLCNQAKLLLKITRGDYWPCLGVKLVVVGLDHFDVRTQLIGGPGELTGVVLQADQVDS
jgi:hypothetical protein